MVVKRFLIDNLVISSQMIEFYSSFRIISNDEAADSIEFSTYSYSFPTLSYSIIVEEKHMNRD